MHALAFMQSLAKMRALARIGGLGSVLVMTALAVQELVAISAADAAYPSAQTDLVEAPATATGTVLCVLLGLLDVVSVLGAGMDDAPPLAVIIAGGLLGSTTVAAAVPAWGRNRAALLLVIASRALSILLSIPALFDEGVSTGIVATVAITGVVGVVAIALLVPAARRNRVVPS